MSELTKESRLRLEKAAIENLVPAIIRYFTLIPFSLAGKIRLAKYTPVSLEYAILHYDRSLTPTAAFKEVVKLSEKYSVENNESLNLSALKFLTELFSIKDSDSPVRGNSKRLEREKWVPPRESQNKEPIYISYFKLKEHLESKGLTFPNPFEGKYEELIEESLSSGNESRVDIEGDLYQLYLKGKNDLSVKG